MPIARQLKNSASQDSSPVEGHAPWHHPFRYSAIPAELFFDCMEASVSIQSKKESGKNQTLRRGRGNRTPVNGFGDRRTTAVLFLY